MILEEKVIQLLKEYERLSKKELKKLLHKTPNDYVPVEETLKKLKKEKPLNRAYSLFVMNTTFIN